MKTRRPGRIRMDLRHGGGTFHEYFDRTEGWQDRIRSWARRLQGRYSLAGGTLTMYYAANRVCFNYVQEQTI